MFPKNIENNEENSQLEKDSSLEDSLAYLLNSFPARVVHLLSCCEPEIVFIESLVILGTLRKNNCQWTAVQTRSPKQGSVANEARFSAEGCRNILTARLRLTEMHFPLVIRE
jgi:hypothetical protein